jgi:predicted O-linked N-acetylglucosamine transferase (SPINDLY family)
MTIASSPAASAAVAKFHTLRIEAERVLAAYAEQPGETGIWQKLLKVRRELAAAIADLPSGQKTGPLVEAACAVLRAFEEAGAADQPAAAEDLALVEGFRKRSWPGLLASMLLVPAWQWTAAPVLDDVQPWLWAEYTRWLFYTPKGFSEVGQASEYAAHYLKRLEQLAGWGTRNRGAAAVQSALRVYRENGNCAALLISESDLRQHFEQRARIFSVEEQAGGTENELLPTAREGRPLRIGFVARRFSVCSETFKTLPLFEQLDPDRFHVLLFACEACESSTENYCRSRAAEFCSLPRDQAGKLELLRGSSLDVIVFCDDPATAASDCARLVVHRIAPLQIVVGSFGVTSGSPACDLFVSGALTSDINARRQTSERLGLVSGPAHSFNFDLDRIEAGGALIAREALGLSDGAVLFVAAAGADAITPEMQHAWAGLLARVPDAKLLLGLWAPDSQAKPSVKRLCADFDRVLAGQGVGGDRFIVFEEPLRTRSKLKVLLQVGDIHLDVYPLSQTDSVVAALELGLPVVAWQGEVTRSRGAAGLLRQMGLDGCVASSESDYLKIAGALAAKRGDRDALRSTITAAMEKLPRFRDSLATSDAFGALVERAYDELLANGSEEFRKDKAPVICTVADAKATLDTARGFLESGLSSEAENQARSLLAVDPTSIAGRHLMGLALAAGGRLQRASDYLLAAVMSGCDEVVVWRDLSGILKRLGDYQGAITALQTALKLDQKDVESWFMLGELAREQGHAGILRDVAQVTFELAPDDPRTSLFSVPAL